jgi:hypothetical protein
MRKPSVKAAWSRAKAEIYSVLSEDMKISAERMDGILARHGVRAAPKNCSGLTACLSGSAS